ncbi:MAG: ABC transporter permease [Gordonia sp. (in: high G+C Gram-positive bacteria)]
MTVTSTAAPPQPRPAAIADSLMLAGRHLRLMSRRPSSIMGAIVLPVIFAVLFFTVFGRVMDRAGIDYAQYLLPAVVIQAVFFSGMSGSVWAAEDALSGMIARLRAMPIARPAPVAGLLCGETARSLLGSAVLVAIGHAFGFRFQTGFLGVLGFVGLVIAASAAIVLPYLVLGFALADPEPAQAIGGVIYFPLLLVSTLFVPASAYPDWLRPIVENQPLSQIVEAMRAVTTSGSVDTPTHVLIAVAWVVGSVLVFGALAPRAFGRTK